MNKCKSVSFINPTITVRIDITVASDRRDITKEELDKTLSELTDSAMRSLESAIYVNAPLNKVRVR